MRKVLCHKGPVRHKFPAAVATNLTGGRVRISTTRTHILCIQWPFHRLGWGWRQKRKARKWDSRQCQKTNSQEQESTGPDCPVSLCSALVLTSGSQEGVAHGSLKALIQLTPPSTLTGARGWAVF